MYLATTDALSEYPKEFTEKICEEMAETFYELARKIL